LKQVSISVEVEIDDLLDVFIACSNKLVKETLDDLGFTASGKAY